MTAVKFLTLTFEFDRNGYKIDQHAKYLGQRSFRSEAVFLHTRRTDCFSWTKWSITKIPDEVFTLKHRAATNYLRNVVCSWYYNGSTAKGVARSRKALALNSSRVALCQSSIHDRRLSALWMAWEGAICWYTFIPAFFNTPALDWRSVQVARLPSRGASPSYLNMLVTGRFPRQDVSPTRLFPDIMYVSRPIRSFCSCVSCFM